MFISKVGEKSESDLAISGRYSAPNAGGSVEVESFGGNNENQELILVVAELPALHSNDFEQAVSNSG